MKDGYGAPHIKAYTSLGEITERIVDFAYKFSQKGDDVCQIRIESDIMDLPDAPIYQEGVEFTIIWGYIAEAEKQKRLVVIRNVKVGYTEEGISLDLLLTDKASLIKTNSSKRVYNKKSVKNINDDVASRNGLVGEYNWKYEAPKSGSLLAASTTLPTATYQPNPDIRVYDSLPQANRSDYEILKEAADNDPSGPYEIVGRDNKIIVQKPNFKQAPIKTYKWKGEDGELLQFVPESKEYFAGSGSMGITSTTVNPKTKTFEESTITEGNNGVETKLSDQIASPNYDDQDDGPGILSQFAGFLSDVVDDFTNALNNSFSTNDATTPTKRPTPVRDDGVLLEKNGVKFRKLDNTDYIEGGDKSVNPVKDLGFDNTKKDIWQGRTFRYGTYNTESQSFLNLSKFNTAAVDKTATITKKPYIPTYLTGQHSPSIEEDHKKASGKASSVQHKKSMDKNPATARVVGNVIIESGKVITIEGVALKFAGNYYIQECTHRMRPGDYFFIEMEFRRNAIGRVKKQSKNTVDVSTKYQKRGNKLEVNSSKGPLENTPTKKKIESTDSSKPNPLLDKYKFKDTPRGFENNGILP